MKPYQTYQLIHIPTLEVGDIIIPISKETLGYHDVVMEKEPFWYVESRYELDGEPAIECYSLTNPTRSGVSFLGKYSFARKLYPKGSLTFKALQFPLGFVFYKDGMRYRLSTVGLCHLEENYICSGGKDGHLLPAVMNSDSILVGVSSQEEATTLWGICCP